MFFWADSLTGFPTLLLLLFDGINTFKRWSWHERRFISVVLMC